MLARQKTESISGKRSTNMFPKHVTHCSSGYTEESRASETIQEARHQHSLDIRRDRTRNHPDQEEGEGANVDWSSSKELQFAPVSKDCLCGKGYANAGSFVRTSESGLRIIGPAPSPATNIDRPSVHTRRETPNSGSSWPYVDVYSDEVHVLD